MARSRVPILVGAILREQERPNDLGHDPSFEEWMTWLSETRAWSGFCESVSTLVSTAIQDWGVADAHAYRLSRHEDGVHLQVDTGGLIRVYSTDIPISTDDLVTIRADMTSVVEQLVFPQAYDTFMDHLESMLGIMASAEAFYRDCMRIESMMRSRAVDLVTDAISAHWGDQGVKILPGGGSIPRWLDEWMATHVAITWFSPVLITARIGHHTHTIRADRAWCSPLPPAGSRRLADVI